jgi:hypothetical protein
MHSPRAQHLAHLVSTPLQAGSVGPIVVAAPCLGFSLGLLLGLGRLPVLAALPDHARRCSDPRSDGGALPGITANGAANSADGRPAGRPAYCPAPLGRRCSSTLLGLGWIYPRLPFGPLMTSELILLELLLALPILRVGKDLGRHLTGDQTERQYNVHDYTSSMQHVSSSVIVHAHTTFHPCLVHGGLPGCRHRLSGTACATSARIAISSLFSI